MTSALPLKTAAKQPWRRADADPTSEDWRVYADPRIQARLQASHAPQAGFEAQTGRENGASA